MDHAAIGLRPHSGWAALVAVAGTAAAPEVVDRRRVELVAAGDPNQPYHAAEDLGLEEARKLLTRLEKGSERLAAKALSEAADASRRKGRALVAGGLVLASGRPLPALPEILASHALIHTADGEHYRRALRDAAASLRLPLLEVKEKELWSRASKRLGRSPERLHREIDALGKPLGPPWTADQKLAALIAWTALAGERS